MAAAITITPSEIQEGDQVTIDGTGFLPNTKVVVTIPQLGIEADIVSDASGEFNGSDLPDKATAVLTLTGNAVAAETVSVAGVVYTWRAAVGATANEVLIGASASASLDNLKSAVNADGNTAVYGSSTVANPNAGAGAKTATTLTFYAKAGGTGGNALASTDTMTNGSFGGGTFSGGNVATGTNPLVFTPQQVVPFTVNATDGTNTATTTARVVSE